MARKMSFNFNPGALIDRLGLNPRERRLVVILGWVLGALIVLGIPIGLQVYVLSRQGELTELRDAITSVQAARAQVAERKARKDSITQRYQRPAPSLAGFLEGLAKEQKLTVYDATDRPDVTIGKRYVERNTVIHFKKVGMGPVIKFVEAVEKSGYPVRVTRFNVRKRGGETDSFDVEVGVSAFDRTEPKKEEKDKETKEGKAP